VLGGGEESVGFKEMGESVVNDPLQEFAYLACEGDRSVVFKEAWGFVGFEDGKLCRNMVYSSRGVDLNIFS
jgi:hypothetical protein